MTLGMDRLRMQRRNHDAYARYARNGWLPHTDARAYTCGWCDCQVSSDIGLWKRTESIDVRMFFGSMRPQVFHRDIRVCTQCGGPTLFNEEYQYPRATEGKNFDKAGQPDDVITVLDLYDEARIAMSAGAFSCAVLMFRKLLMHVAVQQGAAIRELLRQRHHIIPPEEDDFRIITGEIIARFAAGSSRTLSILLAVLAGLSLLVGGVVLMNILLISVKERTKEIGLRRAVGASRRDVFAQFLTESLTVTLLGMAAGLLVGWGICVVLPRFTQMPVAISWEPVALAAAAAVVVGTFFGIQPARRAARLNPVEALR